MRELREYKDEIFRRSADKKRQIKKRRRIVLGMGIPLCLCCVITAVLLSGPSMDKNAFAPNRGESCDMAAENGMLESPMAVFQVTDPTNAALVLDILQNEEPEYSLNTEELDRENTLADQTCHVYSLTLRCPDGSTAIYRVQGQEVFCQSTGQTLWLSDRQTRTLYAFLTEIDEPEDDPDQSFLARVLECGEGWVLVEPLEGEPERTSCDKISIATGKLEKISITVGTKVEITYDGQIMESYPAQIHAISWRLV